MCNQQNDHAAAAATEDQWKTGSPAEFAIDLARWAGLPHASEAAHTEDSRAMTDQSGASAEMVAAPRASARQAEPIDLLQAIFNEIGGELFDMQSAGTWLRVADAVWKVCTASAPSHTSGHCEHARHMVATRYYPDFDAGLMRVSEYGAWVRYDAASAPSAAPAALTATDEMIDAACNAVPDLYRVDAMRAIEAAFALLAAQPSGDSAPAEPGTKEARQFLSDVMTAAGLVSHGKQSKALGERLGAACMRLYSKIAQIEAATAEPAPDDRQGVALSVTGDEVRAIVRAAHPGGSDHPSGPDYVMATVAHLNRRASSSRAEVERDAAMKSNVLRITAKELLDAFELDSETRASIDATMLAAAEAPNAEKGE